MRLSRALLVSIVFCSRALSGDEARIDALVERFCNGGVVERRAAGQALAEYGRAAWPRFRKLLSHDDPDIRRRARLAWIAIVTDTGKGWSIAKPDTTYDVDSGLPMRVFDRKTGVELALLKPGRAVVDGVTYELKRRLYVGVHEVTVAQYTRGRADLMHFHRRDRAKLPITDITRKDIDKFLKDTGLRLPTAAEWEYACFAGGPQRLTVLTVPLPTSTERRNGFGLCDMIGNVAEWCDDNRVRGGNHQLKLLAIEVEPSAKGPFFGFRVVRAPDKQTAK